MRSSAAIAAALLLLLGSPSGAAPQPVIPSAADLAHFDEAAAEHGDDPDLAWAAAMAHLQAGDPSAADRFVTFQARWPGLRPDGDLQLGVALAAAGRDAEALAAFDRALTLDPTSAPAELHRALVLRRLGRSDEADAALERTAALAPELAPETLLLRGISRIESGDQAEATRLLHTAIEMEPTGEAARRARMLLPAPEIVPSGRWFSLMARSGIEYDSNVTLDSGLPIVGVGTNKADESSVFGAGVVLRPLRTERFDLSLGYRFDGSLHLNQTDYDLLNHLAYLSLLFRASNRISLRFDGCYDRSMLGGSNYGESYLGRQNLFVSFGERFGVTRFYVDAAHQSYFEVPTLSSLDRDGNEYGLGVEHSFAVPGWRSALLTLGTRASRFDSEAQRDFLGFEGAYDFMRFEGNVALRMPLFWKIWATAGVSLAREHYDNRNVIDFLTDNGVGDPNPSARRDWVAEAAISLVRPVTRRIDAELGWHYTHRDSNVDLYAYDRNLVGLYFTVHSD